MLNVLGLISYKQLKFKKARELWNLSFSIDKNYKALEYLKNSKIEKNAEDYYFLMNLISKNESTNREEFIELERLNLKVNIFLGYIDYKNKKYLKALKHIKNIDYSNKEEFDLFLHLRITVIQKIIARVAVCIAFIIFLSSIVIILL